MAAPPTLSPWPAPTLADAAPHGVVEPIQPQVSDPPPHTLMASMRTRAKWLSSSSERAEHAAAKEEQRLRLEIANLPAGWCVLQSIELGGQGAIDHLVIGPGGVFIVDIEHQAGANVWVSMHKVMINGREGDHLRRARFVARRSSSLLTDACGFDVTVQSILVLIGAAAVQTLSRPAEVHVRTQHDIRDWLCRQPTRLDPEKVTAIHERANRVETWRPATG